MLNYMKQILTYFSFMYFIFIAFSIYFRTIGSAVGFCSGLAGYLIADQLIVYLVSIPKPRVLFLEKILKH